MSPSRPVGRRGSIASVEGVKPYMLPAASRNRILKPEGRAARRASVDMALVNQSGGIAVKDDPAGALNKLNGDEALMAGRFEEVPLI